MLKSWGSWYSSGLTETCGASFVSVPDVMSMVGTVGVPLPNIEVCLQSVPELGYDALSENARGEVCIRGKPVFLGYHKRDELTEEVKVDEWFHTGTYPVTPY
jgi:long-chain acyl-CoA synthetase